jgi:hypothetical protein
MTFLLRALQLPAISKKKKKTKRIQVDPRQKRRMANPTSRKPAQPPTSNHPKTLQNSLIPTPAHSQKTSEDVSSVPSRPAEKYSPKARAIAKPPQGATPPHSTAAPPAIPEPHS